MKRLCFACERKLGGNPYIVDTRDNQIVYVGSECYKRIKLSGELGYQPPHGGPRLFLIPRGLSQQEVNLLHISASALLRKMQEV